MSHIDRLFHSLEPLIAGLVEQVAGVVYDTTFPDDAWPGLCCFRVDRGVAYYYDGQRWLSMHEHTQAFGFPRVLQNSLDGQAGALDRSGIVGQAVVEQRHRVRWTSATVRTFVETPNDAMNYWRVDLVVTGTITNRVVLATMNTSLDAGNTSVMRLAAPAADSTAGDHIVYVNATKIGSPGNLAVVADLKYRLLG